MKKISKHSNRARNYKEFMQSKGLSRPQTEPKSETRPEHVCAIYYWGLRDM